MLVSVSESDAASLPIWRRAWGGGLASLLGAGLGLTPVPGAGELPKSAADWEVFTQLAAAEGVLSWLARIQPGAAPAALLAPAHEEAASVAARNAFLAADLVALHEAFLGRDIPLIAYKGVVASLQLHHDLRLRPAGDIDVVVRPDRWDAASAVLAHLGYQQVAIYPKALQGTFLNGERGTVVDLHWGFPPDYAPMNDTLLWECLGTTALFGSSIPTLSSQDAVIVACVNLVKEYWKASLHQVVDVAVGLAPLDSSAWEALRARARLLGCERFVRVAGHVVAATFGEMICPPAARACRGSLERLAEEAVAGLRGRLDLPMAQRKWHGVVLQDRIGRRIAHAAAYGFQPTNAERALVPLPEPLAFLHYGVRPARLLALRVRRLISNGRSERI